MEWYGEESREEREAGVVGVPPVEVGEYDHSEYKERGQHQQPVDNIGYTFLQRRNKHLVKFRN